MRILDRLPIYDEPAIIRVQGDVVQVWRNQIIVWLSIGDVSRVFPAILDTGHSHNLAIGRGQFDRWCGADLPQIGTAKIGRVTIPQYRADVRLHRNARGRHELKGDTYSLRMDQGISIVPDDSGAAPRLPLLGLRAIVNNELILTIDGKRRQLTLKTAGTF
jgi:hypothetical protein